MHTYRKHCKTLLNTPNVKRKITYFLIGCLLTFLFLLFLYKKNTSHFNYSYNKIIIRVHRDEIMGIKENPREYRKMVIDMDNSADFSAETNISSLDGSQTDKNPDIEPLAPITPFVDSTVSTNTDSDGNIDPDAQTTPSIGDTTLLIASIPEYDFSPLYFWGYYEFGDKITPQDIDNIEIRIEAFHNNEEGGIKFTQLLESLDENNESLANILKKIADFKSEEASNGDLVNSKDYYENAIDHLYVYSKNNSFEALEQAAIYAESAVEDEQIDASVGYHNYIMYIETAVIGFICVLDSDWDEYASGSSEDVKYRIGKLVYKPSINLQHITKQEKYYSLTGSYIILQDAYSHSTSESKYSVETAFYFLGVCTDMVKFMEPSERRENICREGIGAYAEFDRRGREHPNNSTYIKYSQDAIEKLSYLESMISDTAITDTQTTKENISEN